MTDRSLAYIIKSQRPLVAAPSDTVQKACAAMRDKRCGSVLIVDENQTLVGIFTCRDAVAFLASGGDSRQIPLSKVMTERPVTIEPEHPAIDALRVMADHGFHHLPVLEGAHIWGVVSRGDFKGMEIDRLDVEEHLAEVLR